MRLLLPITLTLAMCTSFQSIAASKLYIPDSVSLLAVNMEKPETKGGFFSENTTLELPDGMNQLVFKYQTEFEIGDVIKTVYSDAVIVKFNSSNEELVFELPSFSSYRQAEKGMFPLKWKLLNKSGESIILTQDTLLSSGVQFGRNYPQEARNYNIAGGLASVPVTYVVANQFEETIAASELAQTSVTLDNQPSIEQFKDMYKGLSLEDKNELKEWINRQK